MSDDSKRDIDLPPREWRSDRAKPREPFFGPGAGPLLFQLLAAAIGLGLLLAVLLMFGVAKNWAVGLIWPEPQRRPALAPGETVEIDGYKVTRTK